MIETFYVSFVCFFILVYPKIHTSYVSSIRQCNQRKDNDQSEVTSVMAESSSRKNECSLFHFSLDAFIVKQKFVLRHILIAAVSLIRLVSSRPSSKLVLPSERNIGIIIKSTSGLYYYSYDLPVVSSSEKQFVVYGRLRIIREDSRICFQR